MKLLNYLAKVLTHPDPAENHCGTTPLKRGPGYPPLKGVWGMIRCGRIFKLSQSSRTNKACHPERWPAEFRPEPKDLPGCEDGYNGGICPSLMHPLIPGDPSAAVGMTDVVGKRQVLSFFMVIIAILFLGLPALTYAQNFTQTVSRTAQFADINDAGNELAVYNIHGSVTIEGYDGNEIQVTARQELEGNDREIERAREELEFVVEQDGDRLLVYIDAPFIQIKKRDGRISYNINCWDDNYDFLYDITVRVPRTAHVYVSTINRGNVLIKDTQGDVHASNVNGSLELTGISGPTKATTVNGDITIRYRQSPREDSEFNTINGTIEVNYPEDLSADIRFKSMHGDLYTDFQNVKHLPARVEQSKKNRRGSVTYHIDKYAPIRIGTGGPVFSFEVLNGDVYVKRIKS